MLSPEDINRHRSTAFALSMKTRLVGDHRAQAAYELAEAFLELTTPDPRAKFIEPEIMLASGRYFHFLHPEDFDWNIDDVAHGLSQQCRFGGHSRWFYSIAQHSVLASYCVEPKFAREALLHDAHEFALLDVMTPLKILLPEYRRLEHLAETAMRRAYGLPETMSREVKQADLVMLATERRDLMPSEEQNWGVLAGVEPRTWKIGVLSPQDAKEAFMRRYEELIKVPTKSDFVFEASADDQVGQSRHPLADTPCKHPHTKPFAPLSIDYANI